MTRGEDYEFLKAWGSWRLETQVGGCCPGGPLFLSRSSPSSRLTPTTQLGPRRNAHIHKGGERARQGGGQPASHTCATLPATPSFFLPRPQSAKAAALHRGFEGHDPSKPSQSLRLGPCDSPPIGAQSALLAESRAKSSNNPSTPLSIKGKCLENCTPMTILQSQKPPSQASVLVATSKLTLGVRTQASKPPSTLLDERTDPVRMDYGHNSNCKSFSLCLGAAQRS